MNTKLKNVIQWTLYVLIVLIVLIGYLVPFGFYAFSKTPPEKLISLLNYAGIGISLSSLALAFYSMHTSNESQKRLESSLFEVSSIQKDSDTILHEIRIITQTILNSQDRIESQLVTIPSVADSSDGTDTSAWLQDKTGPKG